jgi:gamma-glutamyltranspeptidase/glutathione hydrolase
MSFTTRPDIQGTFGTVATTHWIASAAGMRMLELGGTAVDAAAGAGFVLHVVEPHLNGPLGDMPALIRPAGVEVPLVVCGQGPAPAAATIAHYRAEGLDHVPGAGLLATVVPGAYDAWMLMLEDHGRLDLTEILGPAIHYARNGHPLLPRVSQSIDSLAAFFRAEWPSSAATWLPGGAPPAPGALFSNPVLADTWARLLAETEQAGSRVARIRAARRLFAEGFIADAVDRFLGTATLADSTGERRKGVLSGADMAAFRASYEAPVSGLYDD